MSLGSFFLMVAFGAYDDMPDRPDLPYSKYYFGAAGIVVLVATLIATYVVYRYANQPLEAEVLDDDS